MVNSGGVVLEGRPRRRGQQYRPNPLRQRQPSPTRTLLQLGELCLFVLTDFVRSGGFSAHRQSWILEAGHTLVVRRWQDSLGVGGGLRD